MVNNILPEVAPAFFYGVLIAYADNTLYNGHKKVLGITHNRVPAISINNNEMKVVPYPADQDFSVDLLKSWLTKFVKGEISEKETGFGDVIDADIKYML